jgi:DNA primase
MIPKSFVQELLNRVDIADVIESHLPLKRAGANLIACCPFHSEKTPSFTVSPTKQFYHCFGCGAHGTALGFLMEYSGLSFVEAVKDLAQRVGLQVPEVERQPRHDAARQGETSEDLAELLQRATGFYRAELKKSERAIAYLKGRGLSGEIAARFGLGYAPAGWQPLSAAFPDYAARALVDAGLVIQGEDGKRYDRFRDRIMFPIVSQRGQVIGFGGRVLDQSEPKYLNSPETPLFEKGRELYGLFQGRQGIRHAGRVLVVEGYMDVVALAQFGVDYAVATLGTATTPWQVQKLLRRADKVVFCFDGDAAGRRAAWRALENSLEQLQDGKQVRFLFLPPEHDPDSFVRAQGREALERLLAEAVPLSEFLLSQLRTGGDLTSEEGRSAVLQAARPLVTTIAAPILQVGVVERLAEMTGRTRDDAYRLMQMRPPRNPGPTRLRATQAMASKAPPRASPYRKLLKCLIHSPELVGRCHALNFDEPEAEADALRDVVCLLVAGEGAGPAWLDQLKGGVHQKLLRQVQGEVVSEWGAGFDVEAEFSSAVMGIEEKTRHHALTELLRAGEREGWTPERKEALRRLQQRPIRGDAAGAAGR